jgi:hypothetical protein
MSLLLTKNNENSCNADHSFRLPRISRAPDPRPDFCEIPASLQPARTPATWRLLAAVRTGDRLMKALIGRDKGDIRREGVRTRKSRRDAMPSSKLRPALSLTSLRRRNAINEKWKRSGARDDGRGRCRRQGQQETKARRPRRGPIHDFLRRLLLL